MTETMRVFRLAGSLGEYPGYDDAYAGTDNDPADIDWALIDGAQRGKAIGLRATEGWERVSSPIRFQVGERPTLEAAIWPVLETDGELDTASLKAAVDAAVVAAGFTLGSP